MYILIVDDEPVIRKGIRKLLESSPVAAFHVLEAENGEEALAVISHDKPDVVITDIQMNVMDGLSLIENIRSTHNDTEIIVLTGHADFNYVQTALRHQVQDYLLKPITQDNLNEVLFKTLLKDPGRWTAKLDDLTIRLMTEATQSLAKAVLGENKKETSSVLAEWFTYCRGRRYSLLELKRVMAHFDLLFRSELYMILKELAQEQGTENKRNSHSFDQIQEHWEEYVQKWIHHISMKRTPRNKRIVDEALLLIERSYSDKELNLQAIADHMGVSRAYMSKMFRDVMMQPITQYLNDFRLEKAKERLISHPDEKIVAVAERCGFSDYPYFSKVFKKRFGVSPNELREKI